MKNLTLQNILQRLNRREYVVGVLGLGYVGVPIALAALKEGYRVLGFDTSSERVTELNKGHCSIKHIDSRPIARAVKTGMFLATEDFGKLREADAILIAVPTPLDLNDQPNLFYIEESAKQIAAVLRRGQLVVLESTTWPGTTSEVVKPILERSNLVCSHDFFLAFSPEREDPGNPDYETVTIPKVIGADDDASLQLASALYQSLNINTVPVSSTATSEAVKLTENIFRSVNIALVNELKIVFTKMGIDVWEVIEAAKSKPFGYMPFYPGPGTGGHCIPIDPVYLTWKAREFGVNTDLIELASQINSAMPKYVLAKLSNALHFHAGRDLNKAQILLIGMAYKKNIDDMRKSPSLKLLKLIEEQGAIVHYHDPFIPELSKACEEPALIGRRSVSLHFDALARYDAIIIATDHDDIDWERLVKQAKLVIDTRNICDRLGLYDAHIIKA